MTRLSDIMEKQARLLSSKLFLKRRQVEVLLNRNVLAWKDAEKCSKGSSGISNISETAHSHAVLVCEIVAVRKTEEGDHDDTETRRSQKKTKQHSEQYPYAFTVSYVRRTRQHQWRCSDVTFHCASQGLCEQWIQVINGQLSFLPNRPKSLLVYINPYGGKRLGKRIYEQKVAPLFRRACISADVIVTECANHARDHLKTEANLDKYDGVVCVGGDGMFSEILHGLVTRTQTDQGVDQNQSDADLVPCSLRIGIIPAGSTDCICFATVGTNDPVTSALHIIVGVKTFLSHNYYEGTISFLPAEDNMGNPRDKLQCRSGCHVCQHKPSSKDTHCETSEGKEKSDKDGSRVWSEIRGKFIAINSASMSCACPRSPKGLSPSAHLADGTTDLILVRKCSRLDFLRHLLRHTNKEDQFDHSFVEVHRVQKFRFQPRHHELVSLEDLSEPQKKTGFSPICSTATTCNYTSAHSSWNCDGEILPHTAIQVSVQCQLIRLFARGIEEQRQRVSEDSCTLWAPEPGTHQSVD